VLAQEEAKSEPDKDEGGSTVGVGGGSASDVGATAVATTATTTGSPAPPPPSATLQFIGVNQDGTLTGGTQFLGQLLGDLRILVHWKNLSGSHNQRIVLYIPDGSLYQQISAPFVGTPVETRLPVGGTWITQHALFGAWRVEVFFDLDRTPITSGVFVLTP
jgi:hypothetical protein